MMRRFTATLLLAGVCAVPGLTMGKPLEAELVLPRGRTWKGSIISRNGSQLSFKREGAPAAVDMGISMVKEFNFPVNLDRKALAKLIDGMKYTDAISMIETAIAPYSSYNDVVNNLTPYKHKLMVLSYKNRDYSRVLQLCNEIGGDTRYPEIQESCQIHKVLTLIESEKSEEAAAYLNELGWNKNLGNESGAQRLFVAAKLYRLQGEYMQALELAAKVVAFYSAEPEWISPAELLCAELYTELGMYESASEVIRQIKVLHKNTPENAKAAELEKRVDVLLRESLTTTEGEK